MPCPSTMKGCGGWLEPSVFFCIWALWVRKGYAHFFSHSSLPLLYPQTQYGITVFCCQRCMHRHRSGSGSSKFVSDDSSSYFRSCLYITLSGVRTSQVQFQFNRLVLPSEYNKWCVHRANGLIGGFCDTIQYPWTHEALKRVSDAPSEVTGPNFGRTR
jgi:hypothetical protein